MKLSVVYAASLRMFVRFEKNDLTYTIIRFDILGPVVRKLDNAIHWINLYPVDNAIDFPNAWPTG